MRNSNIMTQAVKPSDFKVFKFSLLATLAALATIVAVTPAPAASLAKVFSPNDANSSRTVDHDSWNGLLATYVKRDASGLNRVDYKAFKAGGHGALKTYLVSLQGVDVATLNRNEQYAFWANLYNAKTIDIVLDHLPVASIKKINLGGGLFTVITGGPWKADVVTVNGTKLSLDDIEHEIMRKIFRDPRIHYAVNCASVGCPNLRDQAFTGENLDTMLDAGARDYINNGRGVKVTGGRVTASKIYKWFDVDFGGNESGVLQHLRKYADADLASQLESLDSIDSYVYDWNLNDAKP